MHLPDITEQQRQEIHHALMLRKDELEDIAKKSKKAHAPNSAAEKLLKMYGDDETIDKAKGSRKWIPGLLAMFAPEAELTEQQQQARSQGFDRKVDDAPDMFGGGAEIGGGTPAGERQWLDSRGNPHASEAEAEAADEAQRAFDNPQHAEADERGTYSPPYPVNEDRFGIGAEPASDEQAPGTEPAPEPKVQLALVAGDGNDAGDADYEIVDDSTGDSDGTDDSTYDEKGRCRECRTFRAEPHDPTCKLGRLEALGDLDPEYDLPADGDGDDDQEDGWTAQPGDLRTAPTTE